MSSLKKNRINENNNKKIKFIPALNQKVPITFLALFGNGIASSYLRVVNTPAIAIKLTYTTYMPNSLGEYSLVMTGIDANIKICENEFPLKR